MAVASTYARPRRWGSRFSPSDVASSRLAIQGEIAATTVGQNRPSWTETRLSIALTRRGKSMPKDEWRLARDQSVARRVKFELATGKPLSYEYLAEEITPLDKTNVLTSHSMPRAADASPPDPPRLERALRPNPPSGAPKGAPLSVRFAIARNVGVLVKVDVKSRISIVQALEQACTEAATRPGLIPRLNVNGPPVRLQFAIARGVSVTVRVDGEFRMSIVQALEQALAEATAHCDLGEPAIAVLRKKLIDLAEAIAAKNRLSPSWRRKRFGRWRQRLSQVQAPSGFARRMIDFESIVYDANRFSGPWKARRQAWRNECCNAKSFPDLARLLAEFAELFQEVRN